MNKIAPTEITSTTGLVLNTPDWFQDPEFKQWLNNPDNVLFTWHEKGSEPSEWSDIVLLVDPSMNGEGVGSDMPERFWDALIEICKQQYGANAVNTHIFVRLTNLAT